MISPAVVPEPRREPSLAIVLASDSNMFGMLVEAISSIQAHCRYEHDLWVLSLGLGDVEVETLESMGVRVRDDLAAIPNYEDGGAGAMGMTCRPWLRDLFPGYQVYFWIDADIRVLDEAGIDFYVQEAFRNPGGIAISQETDSSYTLVGSAETARKHHTEKFERFRSVYGDAVAERMRYFTPFNAGIFAMHRDSSVWDRYRINLEQAIANGFDHLAEQDALNLAIVQGETLPSVADPTLNWLCSVSLPRFDEAGGRWTRPSRPYSPISVLHLTSSGSPMNYLGEQISHLEFYHHVGLTSGAGARAEAAR